MSVSSDEIVLRGAEAARAQRIDLVAPAVSTGMDNSSLNPTGPWAADVRSTFAQARNEGHAVGRQEGWEVGLTQGLAEASEQTAQLASMIDDLADQVETSIEDIGQRLAREVTELALTIAEAVIGRELRCAQDLGAEAIVRCLQLAPATGAVVAHLHPDDIERLGPVEGLANRQLSVVADPKLARGDAMVIVDETVIDGRLGLALERVAQVLS